MNAEFNLNPMHFNTSPLSFFFFFLDKHRSNINIVPNTTMEISRGQDEHKSTCKEKKHTLPLVVSESWRVQALVKLIEPSFKDNAIPVVAVE